MIIYNGNYTVYMHINKTNGKTYVGITNRKPERRWQNGNGYEYNGHFWSAIKKYGWNGFYHDIFASNLTQEEACNMEQLQIKHLDTMNPDKGYNLCEGGGQPPVQAGEKNFFYNNHSFAGKNHPMYGKHHSEETRKRMSENHWDCSGKNNPFYGNDMFANGNSPNCKKVMCVETGVIFDAILYAAQAVGVERSNIRRALRSPERTSGGYHWVLVSK